MTKILVAILSLLVVWFWQKTDPGTNHRVVIENAKMDSVSKVQIEVVRLINVEVRPVLSGEMKHQDKTCVSIN